MAVALKDLTLRFYRPTGVVLSSVRHYNPRRVVPKKIRSGCYKVSNNKNVELTYEMAQGPCKLGVTKSWLSWNTSNLKHEEEKTPEVTIEDMFIRRFVTGTWLEVLQSDIIIKRRMNVVYLAIMISKLYRPQKVYFLVGYTEELLSLLLKRPVKLHIQTIHNPEDVVFKKI